MSEDARFFAFLKDRIGLDVASVGEAIIERAVRQRCAASSLADNDAYWLLLLSSAEEQQALIEAVIVPETSFFRYPDSFVALSTLAAARLKELKGARPLRILSLPCSTGEEPYSMAMALFDAGISAQQFKIDAIDISPLSIDRARRGIYGKNSFRGDQLSYRDRYFTALEDGFSLNQRVRDRVTFQSGNMLDPGLLITQLAYDFVFCRNLLIYFDVPTQRQSFEVLKRMTREDGVLFIGPAEGNLLGRMGMSPIGIPQSFAFRRRNETLPEPASTSASDSAKSAPKAVIRPSTPVSAAPRQHIPARPVASTAFAPRSVPVALTSDPDAKTLLNTIAGLANEGRSAEAKAACEQYLQRYEPAAAVFYWLGLLSDVGGEPIAAQGFYRKALYLQPQHPEALAQLAALLAAQGDNAGARRLQERAARGANKGGSN
jgi:chemotaxis protein methyltransferase WspC